jgi:hypothetical protein
MWSGEARVMWRSSSGYTPQSMDGIIWRFCSWRGQPTPDLSRKDVHAFLGTSCHVNSSGSPQQKLGNGTCETRPGTYLPGTYRSLKLTTSSLDCFQSQQHPERSRCLSRRTSKFCDDGSFGHSPDTSPSSQRLLFVRLGTKPAGMVLLSSFHSWAPNNLITGVPRGQLPQILDVGGC